MLVHSKKIKAKRSFLCSRFTARRLGRSARGAARWARTPNKLHFFFPGFVWGTIENLFNHEETLKRLASANTWVGFLQ